MRRPPQDRPAHHAGWERLATQSPDLGSPEHRARGQGHVTTGDGRLGSRVRTHMPRDCGWGPAVPLWGLRDPLEPSFLGAGAPRKSETIQDPHLEVRLGWPLHFSQEARGGPRGLGTNLHRQGKVAAHPWHPSSAHWEAGSPSVPQTPCPTCRRDSSCSCGPPGRRDSRVQRARRQPNHLSDPAPCLGGHPHILYQIPEVWEGSSLCVWPTHPRGARHRV